MIRNASEFAGLSGFVWFFGVVEDRNDPLKLGRVRVRCHGWHDPDLVVLPTSELPWALPVQPVTSAAVDDVGTSPTGILPGSWVIGFFMDGQLAQQPMVLGTVAGIPQVLGADLPQSRGFRDPSGVRPSRKDEPDVNRLARAEDGYKHGTIVSRETLRRVGIETARGPSWDEPRSSASSVYPYNSVKETESGHVFEVDDTPGAERILERHCSGTFREVTATGDQLIRIIGSNYVVVAGSDRVYVDGNADLTVTGTLRIKAGAIDIQTGDMTLDATGSLRERIVGEHSTRHEGVRREHFGSDTYTRKDPGIDHSCPTDVRPSDDDCSEVPTP